MKTALKILLPLVVLALGVAGGTALYRARTPPETRPAVVPPPVVRVLTVKRQETTLSVRAEGTVAPRTEIALVPEVSGRVTAVAPSLASGGFFEKDAILVTIDPRDYEAAVMRARAGVAQAASRLVAEEAEAAVARKEWERLAKGKPSPLAVREPQVAEARAALASAQAALEQAGRDLARTKLRAPFAGRVRAKNVDVGQVVSRGAPLATLYAVDYAEIRLPVPDDQMAFLDLPLDFRGEGKQAAPGPAVVVRARFAGRTHAWDGRIVRTEGTLDPRSRMVMAVARVENPYGRGEDPDRPPLAVGLFVEAEIRGRTFLDVALLPRAALRGRDRVLVVNGEDRLHFRKIEILRTDGEEVVVRSGLAEGERVCLTPLDTVVDGMAVRVAGAEAATEQDPKETNHGGTEDTE